MSADLLASFVDELPFGLRDPVLGYARSVRDAAPQILKQAHVRRTDETVDKLVFLAGIRRLWSIVNAQHWMIESSLKVLKKDGGKEIVAGSTKYAQDSKDVKELKKLRHDLADLLNDHQISKYIYASTLQDVARALSGKKA